MPFRSCYDIIMVFEILTRKEVIDMQYAIAHLDQDGNGDSDKNPYITVDFENNLESCLEAANMMEDEGYKEITPFILEDEGKSGTYTWEYVRLHAI